MRTFSTATAAYFASRSAFVGHVLVWLQGRNRTSGEVETIGFWTGVDHAEFTIRGQLRTYYGAGALLKMDPLRRQTGLKVRSQRISFSQVSPEVMVAVRGYDIRHAPVEVHRALYHPETEVLIDEPHPILLGYIDKINLPTPAKGESAAVTMEVATAGRALTKPVSRFRSDASLRARAAGDGFRRYATLADMAEVEWGR